MKLLLLLADLGYRASCAGFLALALSGCSTLKEEYKEAFEVQIAMTLSCDKAMANSRWVFFGVTANIREADTKKLAAAFCKDSLPAPAPAAALRPAVLP